MFFSINTSATIEDKSLKYIESECSFDSSPLTKEIDLEIEINTLSLSVVDQGRVVQVTGYCPYLLWILCNLQVPVSIQGSLILTSDYDYGFTYKLNKQNEWPVYVDTMNGWVCLGDPKKLGTAVEFVKNCVSIITKEGELSSLWLKPASLPNQLATFSHVS